MNYYCRHKPAQRTQLDCLSDPAGKARKWMSGIFGTLRTVGRTAAGQPTPAACGHSEGRKEGRETGSNCRRRRGGGTRKAEKLFPCLASFPLSALKMWNLIRGHPSDEDNTASDRAYIFSAQFRLRCAPCSLTISEGKSAGREGRDRYPMGKLYGWRGRGLQEWRKEPTSTVMMMAAEMMRGKGNAAAVEI